MHSIKVASQMTGLSTDILRAWERRYGVVKPKRDVKGQRMYGADDLARLRLLRKVVGYGHPINRAATLSMSELEALLAETGDHEAVRRHEALKRRVLAAVEAYRPDQCEETLAIVMATLSPSDAVRYVFSPLLHEAGELWRKGELSIGQGHLLTACMERMLMGTMHIYQKLASGPRVIYGTLSGERHGLGGLMAAFLAATQGIRCCHLGIDLPPAELADAVERTESIALGLSLVATPNAKETTARLEELSDLAPEGIELWLGGPAVDKLVASELPARYVLVRSFDDYAFRLEMLKRASAQSSDSRDVALAQ